MKKSALILSLLLVIILSSCKENKPQSYSEIQWSENQKDSVVYVNHRNSDGSFSNFYMNYLLYRNLFGQGGYGAINNYYQSHPSEFSNQRQYSNYKDRSYFTNKENSNIKKPRSYSSPSRVITKPLETKSKSYSSPSRTSNSYLKRSYSSPSSSPSKNYSSPSRSYSSPSRSYSSPSRSYSSPSRSYSSPSRSFSRGR